MQRLPSTPRPNWQETVESQGFTFHTADGQPYWDESAFYLLTSAEIDTIEKATYELDRMCLAAVQKVIDEQRWGQFGIPEAYRDFVAASWEEDEHTIYGRFDLAFDQNAIPKLLEYNADTPTSLLEAAVVQWHWFRDLHPNLDQFNSIHERLIEAWAAVKLSVPAGQTMYFASLQGSIEDFMNVTYLRDTAVQAGLNTEYITIDDIGWNQPRLAFVDLRERPIRDCFKLYPWEWLIREEFAPQLRLNTTRWLEPPWKMILSNKALLPLLWEMYPGHPNLLAAAFDPVFDSYVRKPTLSREGANIAIVEHGNFVHETDGVYGGPFVYQQLYPLPNFGGNHPVIGSWLVNGYACGIGIREDATPVTGNLSRFVPHVFTPES